VGVFWRQFHSRLPAAEKTFTTGLRLWKCFPMGKFHEVGGIATIAAYSSEWDVRVIALLKNTISTNFYKKIHMSKILHLISGMI
jgi:hypothetical protein